MSGLAKALLISILIMSIIIPASAAAERNPKVGLRKAIRNVVLFNLFYVLSLLYVWSKLM